MSPGSNSFDVPAVRLRTRTSPAFWVVFDFCTACATGCASEISPSRSTGENVTISLVAQTGALRDRIGAAPIQVVALPYVVGRRPLQGEAEPARHPNLMIEDAVPFRLSRDHFMITGGKNRLLILDLGTTLGTIVNGRAIGHHFMNDAAPLRRGENRIVAGGWGSPFEFVVSVGLMVEGAQPGMCL
jgi:hypothetical protein